MRGDICIAMLLPIATVFSPTGLADGHMARNVEFETFEQRFKECISSAAIRTKFEYHHHRGVEVVRELEELLAEEERNILQSRFERDRQSVFEMDVKPLTAFFLHLSPHYHPSHTCTPHTSLPTLYPSHTCTLHISNLTLHPSHILTPQAHLHPSYTFPALIITITPHLVPSHTTHPHITLFIPHSETVKKDLQNSLQRQRTLHSEGSRVAEYCQQKITSTGIHDLIGLVITWGRTRSHAPSFCMM